MVPFSTTLSFMVVKSSLAKMLARLEGIAVDNGEITINNRENGE